MVLFRKIGVPPQYGLIFALFLVFMPACRPKYGCPTNVTNTMDKKKRGNSQLFPKDMRKKMKH